MKYTLGWLALIVFSVAAHATNVLKDVQTSVDKNAFVTDLMFAEPVDADNLNVDFVNHLLQINIPAASIAKAKTNHINKAPVKSVYTYQLKADEVRSRIILDKGQEAKAFESAVEVVKNGNHLQIRVNHVFKQEPAQVSKTLPVIPPKALEASIDDQLRAKAEADKALAPVTGSSTAELPAPAPESATVLVAAPAASVSTASADSLSTSAATQVRKTVEASGTGVATTVVEKEKAVPVLGIVGTQSKNDQEAFHKMLMAIGIVALMGGGLLFALKKWGKASSKLKDTAQIKVLTQHHLGPKKSLAIIRVAGESILIGVTDQNISMIKSLALIDDEFPEQLPSQFTDAIREVEEPRLSIPVKKQSVTEEDDEFAASGLSELKGLIANRLKDMRALQ